MKKTPAPLSNTLGFIAAKAIDERMHAEQQERDKFPKLLMQRWGTMRPMVFDAAKAGKTTYTVPFITSLLNMKTFKPTLDDFLANLPKELAEMREAGQLYVLSSNKDDSIFEVTLVFKSNADEHMAKLKRVRLAADASEEKKKKPKTETKTETKTEVKKEPL